MARPPPKNHFCLQSLQNNNNFGYTLTQFLIYRKHGQSLEVLGHGFYGSIAKRSLQKQWKNPKIHGETKVEGAVSVAPPWIRHWLLLLLSSSLYFISNKLWRKLELSPLSGLRSVAALPCEIQVFCLRCLGVSQCEWLKSRSRCSSRQYSQLHPREVHVVSADAPVNQKRAICFSCKNFRDS